MSKKKPAKKAQKAPVKSLDEIKREERAERIDKIKDVAVRYIYDLGMIVLLTFAFNLLIVTTGFFVGITINLFSYFLSLIAATVVMVFLTGRVRLTRVLLAAGGCLLVTFIGAMVAGGVYDPSYDGNTYHKVAIGLLREGWNPVYESSQAAADRFFNEDQWQVMYGTTMGADSVANTTDHFAKATWFFAASIYWLFGNVEAGKVYNLLGMIAVFAIALPYMREKLDGRLLPAAVVALVLAVTPVCVYQYFDYYVDGFLGAMLFCLVIGLTQMLDRRSRFHGKWAWVTIFASMIVLGNVKVTGLAYGGVFCILAFIASAIPDLRHKRFKAVLIRFGLFVLLAVVTVCWAGFPTYVTNTIDHGNPIYPIALMANVSSDSSTVVETTEGAAAVAAVASAPALSVNIMGDNNMPVGFGGKPWWYTLFYSLFCEMNNNFPDGMSHSDMLKVPFTISELEGYELQSPAYDLRIGGWGVLFSGILIVSLIVYVVNIVVLWRRHRGLSLYAIVLFVFVVLLLAIVPTSWWARYSPYMYLVPALAVFMSFKIATMHADGDGVDGMVDDEDDDEDGADSEEADDEDDAAAVVAKTDKSPGKAARRKKTDPERAEKLACFDRIYGNVVGGALSALMLVNSCLFIQGLVTEMEYSKAMEQQLEVLRGEKIDLYNEYSDQYYPFGGFAFNLEDHNIDYSIVKSEDLSDKYLTYYNRITFGFPEENGELVTAAGGDEAAESSAAAVAAES